MAGAQINPLLIQQLINKKITEIPKSPTISLLPGNYAKLMNKQKESIERIFGENSYMLTCKTCGRKGKYDVGLMVINADLERNEKNPEKVIQTTGYLRCKHCNDAGNWEMPNDFLMMSITVMLMLETNVIENKCTVGKNLLYDGSWHLFSSDAETHLLHKLKTDHHNSFIWSRLGNLYHKGGRPELAACAFEYCIAIDPDQVEAHYTLGTLLVQIKEYEKSAFHLKQMLLCADHYNLIKAEELRELLVNGLSELAFIYQQSNREIDFLPTEEELEAAGKIDVLNYTRKNIEIIHPGNIEFFILAEMFMGSQSNKIPDRLKALKTPKPEKKVKKRHKRNKRK